MAETPAPSSPAARKGSRPPRGQLVVVGVGVVAVGYFLYSRNKAAKAAAAAAAANPSSTAPSNGILTPTPAGTYDPNADTGALLGYLTGLGGPGSTPVTGVGSSPAAPAPDSGTTTPAGPSWTQVQGNGDAGGQVLDVIGSIVAPSTYQGYNVGGGAPVYANIGGTWRIGLPASQIPVGTALATPQANQSAIAGAAGSVREMLQ